ncbi:acyl--CoA ligase [Sinirhodobacter sp. WL0062]|uniref:Acyl--CoA ligase n=1 Tax=Rhodobacter flavimaris TaxID=2907145 RepID=A0ABS8YV08_9RHOB|nr:class I adenylate-forming enzyme family protein [Sinirhodobacter sp. WL0062]MCE5972281.1 acyl--CoA ligase [Sinirhodobacter sp. WL0062]
MIAVHASPPIAPPPAAFNLAAHVLACAPSMGERSAMQILRPTGAERWSYARLEAAVRGAGTGLLAAGLTPGDRVLLRLGNTPEFPVAFLGAIAVGLVPVPTSSQLTVPEVTRIAQEIRPAAVIAGDGIALPDWPAPIIPEAQLRGFEALPPCDYAIGDPNRLAYLIYTSGSSGRARAVMHAHRAIWARQMMHQGWYGMTGADRLLHAGAFNWTYTLGTGLMDPWTLGATVLIPGAGVTPDQLPLLLRRFDATICAAVPGVYRQILKNHANLSLPRLRHCLTAGEAMPTSVRARWNEATGTKIFEALGMSECSTFISASPTRPAPEGAMGYPQDGRSIAVLDQTGAPVARGEAGILAVHRADPGLFLGYWEQPEETASRFTADGEWFLTGDSVAMAEDGAISYLGRNDDMMNAGGFRVSPLEVEATMATCPDAGEVAAVEIRVKAEASVIALAWTGPATEAALTEHAAQNLARYKQPRLWRHVATLPRNANGKIDRRALRADWPVPPETAP